MTKSESPEGMSKSVERLMQLGIDDRPALFREHILNALNALMTHEPETFDRITQHWRDNNVRDVRAIVARVRNASETGKTGKADAATKARSVLAGIIDTAELWIDQRGLPYATVTVVSDQERSHVEHIRVDGQAFSGWIERQYWRATNDALKREPLKEFIGMARARALYSGARHITWIRTAVHDGRIYLDMADPEWRYVEIDCEGWRIVSDPPVRFRRTGSEQSLPTPIRADTKETLARFAEIIRFRDPDDLRLALGYLVAALNPCFPHPIFLLICEPGSAKTTSLRVLRSLIDPRSVMTPGLPRSEDDMVVVSYQQWLPTWDNVGTIKADQSDGLCRLATGGGTEKRALYTDEDMHAIEVRRPILMSGLKMPTARSDFVDRSIALKLSMIEKEQRLPEREVHAMVDALLPQMMGLLLDGASCALRRESEALEMVRGRLPRMADFAVWAEAAGEAFGWAPGEFVSQYNRLLDERMQEAGQEDPLCNLIFEWMCAKAPERVFEGKAEAIRTALRDFAERTDLNREKGFNIWFPQTARAMAGQLELHRRLLGALGVNWTKSADPRSSTAGAVHRLELVARDEEVELVKQQHSRPGIADWKFPSEFSTEDPEGEEDIKLLDI